MLSIPSFFIKIIKTIFSSVTRKIIIAYLIFLIAHALVVTLGTTANGGTISYGSALGQVMKADTSFIFENVGDILSYIGGNIVDFTKSVK